MTRRRGGLWFERKTSQIDRRNPHPSVGLPISLLRKTDGWKSDHTEACGRLRSRLPGGNVNPRRSAIVGELVP